jgi:hypothetical protein
VSYEDYEPPRMSITNLRTGDEVVAQFNPAELVETVAPRWARLAPQGLSHEVHHFQNTSPYQVPIELFFRAYSREELVLIHRARRHLLSWAMPRRIGSDVVGGGPPQLLLVWPGMLSLRCFLTELKLTHSRFNSQSRSVQFTASATFEEEPGTLLTSESVAEDSLLRFGDPFGDTELV